MDMKELLRMAMNGLENLADLFDGQLIFDGQFIYCEYQDDTSFVEQYFSAFWFDVEIELVEDGEYENMWRCIPVYDDTEEDAE
jgi:hypothetical protein